MNRLLLLIALPLAACNQGPSVTAENASTAEVAAKVQAATNGGSFVSPGRWETTMAITKMEIPGAPPQVAETMKGHMGAAKSVISCLTPEEAKQPRGKFFGGDDSCRYERFTMAGGKIDAVMTCAMGGAKRTMTMNGSYSADTYNMAVTSTGAAAPGDPMSGMSMAMKLDAKRTGACKGDEDKMPRGQNPR